MDLYEIFDTEMVGVQPVMPLDVSKYGIVCLQPHALRDVKEALWVQDIMEKPAVEEAPSNLAVMGRYILKPSIFSILEQLKPGKGGEIQLTDALKVLCDNNSLLALPLSGRRYDVGDKLGYIQAMLEFALDRPELRYDLLVYMGELLIKERQQGRKMGLA